MKHLKLSIQLLFVLCTILCPLMEALGSIYSDSPRMEQVGRSQTDSAELSRQISNISSTNYQLPRIEKAEYGATEIVQPDGNHVNMPVLLKIIGQCKSDSSQIDVIITNKSANNYYLPIVSADFANRVLNTNDSNLISFFNFETICKKPGNKVYTWTKKFNFQKDCWHPDYDNTFDTKTLNVEDFYFLKAKDSMHIKVGINLSISLPNCHTLQLRDYDGSQTINISLRYRKKKDFQENAYINPRVLKTIQSSGYSLYRDELISNEYPFHVSRKDRIRYQKENDSLPSVNQSENSKYRARSLEIQRNSLQYKYYNRTIPGLSPLKCKDTYPCNDVMGLTSLRYCFAAFFYPELKEVIFNRIVEIAQLNFRHKIFIQLVQGENSVQLAEQKNKKTKAGHGLIYISIENPTHDELVTKSIELYNNETQRLMSKH